MKKVILNELTVSNFKGVTAHHKFGENENLVSGKNASGKTTIIRAWNWLLSGRCSADTVANSNLFDNKVELNENTPTASVKAVVTINGQRYTIERTAKAGFQRRRGTDKYEKSSSDNYEFFVDEIKRSATEFKDWILANIAPDDMLQYLLGGEFFISQIFDDKKRARQIIERTVGTVTREEMSGDYSDIDELMGRYSLDEIDSRAQNMAKAINERLNEIPALIKTKEAEIAEIEQTDFAANDNEIAKLEAERESLDKQITDMTERVKPQMEAKHKAEMEYQARQDVLDKSWLEWRRSFDTRRQKLLDEINAIRQQNARSESARKEAESRIGLAKSDLKSLENQLSLLNQKRERLLKERDEIKSMAFKGDEGEAIPCPFCGQPLTGEKLQEERDKFEQKKRERLNEIVADGKDTAERIERLNESIERTQKLIAAPLPEVIAQSTEEMERQTLELSNVNTSKIAFMETEQGKALLDDIGAVVIPTVEMPDTTAIVAAKKETNERLVPLYERRGLKSRLSLLKTQLDELHIEQKEKGAQLADFERQRQKVKEYKQEQMEILSRKVNEGLKFSRIEVWSKQKDGQQVPDLVLKDAQGVRYETTNGASRIVTTCDIQRFFCEKLSVNMPCFIDEASVIQRENLPNYEGVQTFLLFCSDEPLKIESR